MRNSGSEAEFNDRSDFGPCDRRRDEKPALTDERDPERSLMRTATSTRPRAFRRPDGARRRDHSVEARSMIESRSRMSRDAAGRLGWGAVLIAVAIGAGGLHSRVLSRVGQSRRFRDGLREESRPPVAHRPVLGRPPHALSVRRSVRSGRPARAAGRPRGGGPLARTAVARQPAVASGRGNRLPRSPRVLETRRDRESGC